MKPRLFARLAAIALGAVVAAGGLAQAQQAPTARALPVVPPLLRVPEAALPIEVRRVQVEAQVVGRVAQTRIEIEFLNPNARLLEGELQFPLRAGQVVTGFALDIDGELRPAVPVEKARGRQVFEDVTRARVDPALLQATEGNNYKLRVYPLPPRGTRRVALEIAETLPQQGSGPQATLAYLLPLGFGATVQQLDVAVRLAPGLQAGGAAQASLGAVRIAPQFERDGGSVVRLSRTGFGGGDTLRVDLRPPAAGLQQLAQTFGDASYFYAEVPLPALAQPRPAPRTVGILWDASGSGERRDIGREIVLLDAFFQAVRNVAVELVVVRDTAEAPRRFAVAGGDWRLLREHLRGLVYDGATRLDRMQLPAAADLGLLFSDGLGTYGDGGLPASAVPLFAINSAPSADMVRLRHAAEASGGQLLDLAQLTPAQAAQELRVQRTRLVQADAAGAADVVAESVYPQQGVLRLAGRMLAPAGTLSLELEEADGRRIRRAIALSGPVAGRAPAAGAALPVAAYRYATLKLAQLEADRAGNREAIRRLGMQFGLVTSGTSLIVLDSVADYARHGIEPPPALRAEYQRLLAQAGRRRELDQQTHLERVVRRFQEKQAWYDRAFPKDEPPRPPSRSAAEEEQAQAQARQRAETQRHAPMPGMAAPRAAMPAPMAPPPAPAPLRMAAAPTSAAATPPSAGGSAIALRPWAPDSAYARRLRAAEPQQMYAIYLDERPSYGGSTAFFLDVAEIFLERGEPQLALRILSNLAELDLENRHILRILAYRLLQAKQVQLALPLLEKVLVLSPDEPQSYRDLGLALAAAGRWQPAVDRLWQVVSRAWADRFPGIELIALAELNAVREQAAAAGVTLDTAKLDARLLRNLPLDLRAVLAWDADNTDIDLHVIDPNGEEAYYGHPLTYQGGRLSNDFTGGYGPEEFALRVAKPGTYTIRADFFGHRQQIVAPATTLMLRLTTGFGTPRQKDQDVVLRLGGTGSRQVLVGTFTVEAP